MLFIDKNVRNVVEARSTHIEKIFCRIRKKTSGNGCGGKDCNICNAHATPVEGISRKLRDILHDDHFLRMIIGGEPDDLFNMAELMWDELVKDFSWEEYSLYFKAKRKKLAKRSVDEIIAFRKHNDLHELFFKIFDYDIWFLNGADSDHYDAYDLAANLDRNTCTYCNRLYTNTMKTRRKKKIMRPTFDHWFSHSKHPMLGLSFYNLIPSCSVCNSSVRGDKEFLLTSHLHPYINSDILEHFKYDYHFFKTTNQYEIFISTKPGVANIFRTLDDLKLKEIYNAHHSELADLVHIKKAYSEKYIDKMVNTFSGVRLSHKEAYRLAFGVELDDEIFYKRPLSKFKKDILRKLNLIDF